jgi:hypothetical protein
MRTLNIYVKGFAIASLSAALLVNASPAAAAQSVTIVENGSKKCVILYGVMANLPEAVASIFGAIIERLGCGM